MRRKKCLKILLIFITATILIYTYEKHGTRLSELADEIQLNVSNLGQLDEIFVESAQNRLYVKQRRNVTSPRHKHYILNTTNLRPSRSGAFYLIDEYTPVFGQSKYCRLKKDETYFKSYVQRRLNRYNLLEKVFKSNPMSGQPYDLLDRCIYKNCFFSCDRSLAHSADALLFHWSDLTERVLGLGVGANIDYDKIYPLLFSFERPSRQVWVLWDDEANVIDPLLDKFKFNWTITYQSTSEASYCSYGCLVMSDETKQTYGDASKFHKLVQAEYNKRSNSAIWFVSNCNAEARMKIAAQLGQHYSLDIYGGCSKQMQEKFPSASQHSKITFKESKCPRGSACEQNTFRSAKFYLSFENSNCSDYITEKFWKSLSNDLIPVVMQPNKEFYERIAPVGSFIHMADFGYDAAKLAAYLNQVGTDFNTYQTYFEWKRDYMAVYDAKTLEQFRICELCARLNNQHLFYNSYYKKVSNFIESACFRT